MATEYRFQHEKKDVALFEKLYCHLYTHTHFGEATKLHTQQILVTEKTRQQTQEIEKSSKNGAEEKRTKTQTHLKNRKCRTKKGGSK